MKKTFIKILVLVIPLLFISSAFVFAQNTDSNPSPTGVDSNISTNIKFENPFAGSGTSLFDFLKTIIDKILLPIGGILAVLAFIYSGFLYVVAQGDESKIKTAHKALLYSAIGTAVLLGSWTIATVVENTINQLK
jgi:type IV secretory pathway VirB2 component (pilin)